MYYSLYYTDNRLLENDTGSVCLGVQRELSCQLSHAQVPSKPAIRKRGNWIQWIDSFADLYNSQRYVHGVMSE